MRDRLLDRRLSVAPMMDWTDRHCRYFLRQFSPRTLLYTEMITAAAITRGPRERLLRHSPQEHPLALQLGGSDPEQLAQAARAGEEAGYLEVNLNCGCPSERVAAGAFGACLMLEPARVADCVAAMRAAVRVPITVKLRIGVVDRAAVGGEQAARAMARFDAQDEEDLLAFCRQISTAGAGALIVHARKAVLGGLSPHENRTVPPLRFDVVARLREQLQGLVPVLVNGGVRTVAAAREALKYSDGVMIGREAYHRPWLLAELQLALWPDDAWQVPTESEVLAAMADYARGECAAGTPLSAITRHMLGLRSGRPGARELRHLLSIGARRVAGPDQLFTQAAEVLENADKRFERTA